MVADIDEVAGKDNEYISHMDINELISMALQVAALYGGDKGLIPNTLNRGDYVTSDIPYGIAMYLEDVYCVSEAVREAVGRRSIFELISDGLPTNVWRDEDLIYTDKPYIGSIANRVDPQDMAVLCYYLQKILNR